jgi:hypothetical protein
MHAMSESFTIARSRCSDLTDAGLHDEIRHHTRSDEEVTSILRCLERFGFDASIRHYELTAKPSHRTHRGASSVTWSISAVRS